MNMKTLAVLVLMGLSLSAMAEESLDNQLKTEELIARRRENQAAAEAAANAQKAQQAAAGNFETGDIFNDCEKASQLPKDANNAALTAKSKECTDLKKLAGQEKFAPIANSKDFTVQSADKTITCKKPQPYTFDYEQCENAVAAYNVVVTAEMGMNETQKIRTDMKNNNIQADASKQAASGDSQTAALDAGIQSNKHQKQIQGEKVAAYSLAVAALVNAYRQIPTKSDALNACGGNPCIPTFQTHEKSILANQSAKAALVVAISTFTAKGIAAGIKMGQYDNAAKQIEKAKAPYEEEGDDMMMERCTFNPTDPLCLKPGQRVAGSQYKSGEFTLGGDGVGNAFNMTPDSDVPVELGAETNLDGETVASINSPFVDDAKEAMDIVNPAGAAQMQAGGPGAGAGGGGAGGGLGGGGASLGGDLAGTDKDANKEANIKANQISGKYNAAGGGGYTGVKGSKKDNANPFASLFDAKSNGGIEEDRSIASEDINGASSGLFQKISKRYGQIQADKRIEAKNLE